MPTRPPLKLTPQERLEALRILAEGGIANPTREEIKAAGEVVRAVRAVVLMGNPTAGRKGH
jgi:hypothetical protein